MKNLNIKYKHGHLYDITTGQRIHLEDGAIFALQGDSSNFMEQDPLNNAVPDSRIRNYEEIKSAVLNQKKLKSYAKILDAGTKLQFTIGITKTKTKEEARRYHFVCELLEDLYLYKKNGWKNNTPAALFECHCVVSENPSDNVEFFEKVYGVSLSNLFEKTCMLFFSNQRSSAGSAFNEFSLLNNSKITIDVLRSKKDLIPVGKLF